MSFLERIAYGFLLGVSRLLDPVMIVFDRVTHMLHAQLAGLRVPLSWQPALLGALWVVPLVLVLRLLGGWLRIGSVVLIAVLAAKAYGLLPQWQAGLRMGR